MVIRKTIVHSRVASPVLHSLEAVGARFSVYGLRHLKMFFIYVSPSREFVIGDYDAIFCGDIPVFAADDQNAKNTLCRSVAPNPFERKLFDFVGGSGVFVHCQSSPTFFGAGCRPDILNFCFE